MVRTSQRAYIGIDPGKKGAISFIDPSGLKFYCRMPEHDKDIYEKIKEFVNAARKRSQHVDAVLERAQAMPGQGTVSMFNYGKGAGFLIGCITALEVPLHEVHPKTWKKEMITSVADRKIKSGSIKTVKQIFPEANLIPERCRKEHDGLAEAILLAEYGRRKSL